MRCNSAVVIAGSCECRSFACAFCGCGSVVVGVVAVGPWAGVLGGVWWRTWFLFTVSSSFRGSQICVHSHFFGVNKISKFPRTAVLTCLRSFWCKFYSAWHDGSKFLAQRLALNAALLIYSLIIFQVS